MASVQDAVVVTAQVGAEVRCLHGAWASARRDREPGPGQRPAECRRVAVGAGAACRGVPSHHPDDASRRDELVQRVVDREVVQPLRQQVVQAGASVPGPGRPRVDPRVEGGLVGPGRQPVVQLVGGVEPRGGRRRPARRGPPGRAARRGLAAAARRRRRSGSPGRAHRGGRHGVAASRRSRRSRPCSCHPAREAHRPRPAGRTRRESRPRRRGGRRVAPAQPIRPTDRHLAAWLQRAAVTSSANRSCSSTSRPPPGEPGADVVTVPHQEVHPGRVGDDVDGLREVDEHQPVSCGEQVVGREVPVREPERASCGHRVAELVEVRRQQVGVRPGLGQPRCRLAVDRDELHQDLGAVDLHRVGHRQAGQPEPRRVSHSAHAHCPAARARPCADFLARARASGERRVRRPSV